VESFSIYQKKKLLLSFEFFIFFIALRHPECISLDHYEFFIEFNNAALPRRTFCDSTQTLFVNLNIHTSVSVAQIIDARNS
jgi:hypothetical protein